MSAQKDTVTSPKQDQEQLPLPLQPLLFPIPKDAVEEPYVDLPDEGESLQDSELSMHETDAPC